MLRIIHCLTFLLMLCSPALAQDISDRIKFKTPGDDGPFPTVILMHWTSGPGPAEARWTKMLNDIGIAAVTLKSYNKISGGFAVYEKNVPDRIEHLKQANAWVRTQGWSNGRVSVLGRSHGSWAVIDAMKAKALNGALYRAVAIAPNCKGARGETPKVKSHTPMLIVTGLRDTVTPPKPCRVFDGANAHVTVAEFNAGHSVDLDNKQATKTILNFLK